MIRQLAIERYRAIRALRLELRPLSVVTGPNGAGKSTLYRALELMRAAAIGDLSHQLAREGGMASAVWAGAPWRNAEEQETGARDGGKGPVRIRFAAILDDLEYDLTLGLPRSTDAALDLDPVVKAETIRALSGSRPVVMAERKGPTLSVRGAEGRMGIAARDLWLFEPALSAIAEPQLYPEIDLVRRSLAAMRFYSQFRVDAGSPLRAPQPAIFTPSVSSDGVDWATAVASLAVVEQNGFPDGAAAQAVAAAFPGGAFEIEVGARAVSVGLRTAEFQRAFDAREMSDGTLRFLAWTAALTAVRPPPFMALNEPESSLHPDLLEPLADLIGQAAERAQILVVTHSERLAERLEIEHAAQRIRLRKDRGETVLA